MRRPSRLAGAATAVVLLLAGCADEDPTVEGEPDTTEEDTAGEDEEDAADDAPDEEPADGGTDDAADEPPEEPTEDADAGTDEPAEEPGDDTDGAAAPTPDPDLLADPCGPHEGREGDAFIDVVSPVEGQDVGGGDEVQLAGCSNVFEANVVWELVSDDGTVLDEGFTTATCGSGCVGSFDEVLDLTAGAGEDGVELQVHSPDVSDGEGDGDELRQTIALTYS